MGKKVLVIGAGVGALSAAIRLQYAGYSVEIFEKEALPGGKMYQIQRDGFTFDVGPTLVMMPSIYQELFLLTGRDPNDYIPMTRLDPMYDVFFTNPERRYSVNTDLTHLMQMAESKGPENARGFLNYLSAIYERYQVALDHFITRPFRRRREAYTPFMLKQALKLKTFDSAERMMADFMPNPDLHQMLSFQTLYIGVSPKDGPSLYNIIPMIELLYGVWFIKGGMHTMAKSLAALFEELGGQIHYNSPVERILTEAGGNRPDGNRKSRHRKPKHSVVGIEVAGKTIEAPYVVCNADFPYAITRLIQEEPVRGRYTPDTVDKMKYSCSCMIFYWGVKGTFPELEVHSFIIAEDLSENLDRIFDGRLIEDPSVYLHIPSKADPSMAPEGHSAFYVLVPVSDLVTSEAKWNDETIAYYREKALAVLKRLPGLESLSELILTEDVFSPQDFESRFNAYRGATFGLRPTLRQSNHWRPQAKSMNCDGLYFCGSSTHPGAGVPIAMQSGKIAAEELCLDEKEENAV